MVTERKILAKFFHEKFPGLMEFLFGKGSFDSVHYKQCEAIPSIVVNDKRQAQAKTKAMYRRKATVVEAEQFLHDKSPLPAGLVSFSDPDDRDKDKRYCGCGYPWAQHAMVQRLGSNACPKDWIIYGQAGVIEIRNQGDFEKTYEYVGDENGD